MKQNNDSFEEVLKNPMYVAMGSVVSLLVVILFCFVVWNVTHAGNDDIVVNSQASNSVEIPSMDDSSDVVLDTDVEPEVDEDEIQESIENRVAEESNDQGVVFTEVEDYVTALEVTNLRSEPSTAQGVNTVVAKLTNGEVVRRVGMNEEVGWSKLIYNEQVVYASTAYLLEVDTE